MGDSFTQFDRETMKPIIGITPLFDEEKDGIWMQTAYINAILRAGGIPVVLPIHTNREEVRQIAHQFDGFLFTGGPDIKPELYGETTLTTCASSIPLRDSMEEKLLHAVYITGKPIMGICRGCQLINVILGGTLYQDIPSQYKTSLVHRQEPPKNKPIHDVSVIEGTLLHRIVKQSNLHVNSLHHQAVKKAAPILQVAAYAEDGIIEAIDQPDHAFLLGIQWHPELMFEKEPLQLRLFEAFIRAIKSVPV